MKKIMFAFVCILCLLGVSALAEGPEVTFSMMSGFYAEPFTLEVKCDSKKEVTEADYELYYDKVKVIKASEKEETEATEAESVEEEATEE